MIISKLQLSLLINLINGDYTMIHLTKSKKKNIIKDRNKHTDSSVSQISLKPFRSSCKKARLGANEGDGKSVCGGRETPI